MTTATPVTPHDSSAVDPSTLPLYQGIALRHVHWVNSPDDEARALQALLRCEAIGFDTESKPTFKKGEISTGPHLIQLATDDTAFLFPVRHAPPSPALKIILESPAVLKAGFGLRDDLRRLKVKLGIELANVLDLAVALRQNKRADVGAKTAVARFFGQRLQKSKKISTTDWSRPNLSDQQLLYAANDAHVALRIYRAWKGAASVPSVSAADVFVEIK